ncbi:anti-sigma factor antagonist [Kibdelosporangium aridum]|uniref:anti-sigma factor antagonist n=1 Tax=Kibdelosporangium aridum TaxID=2030 RepID=UPI0013581233|nr:anti-sigma factor antagonist [Kibdelosporangium aridum]
MSQPPEIDPPADWLDIAHRVVDGTLVVVVSGEVDLHTAPSLRAAVTAGIDQTSASPCILDLTKVTFLDSAGLTALLDATCHAEARHEPLRIIVDGNRPVIRPIEITGLDDTLRLYHSIDEALNSGKRP